MFCLLKKLQLVIFTRFTKILLTGHVLAFVASFILRSSPVLFCLVRRQLCFVIEGALRSAVRIGWRADSWPLENESDFYELADKNLDTS